MSIRIISLCMIVFLTIVSPTMADELDYKPGELLVRFATKPDGKQRTTTELNELLTSIGGGTVKRSYKLVPGLTVVKLSTGVKVTDVLSRFNKTQGILYAEPNYKGKVISTFPNDTRFDELWGMHNTSQTGGTLDADIDAPEAWGIITDSNIIVAVIDTGEVELMVSAELTDGTKFVGTDTIRVIDKDGKKR